MRLIVHGGAGTSPTDPERRQQSLDSAAASGPDADTPIEAVRQTIRVLESDPRFNAGTGSAAQSDGYSRTDAGIMSNDRRVGAVGGMPGVIVSTPDGETGSAFNSVAMATATAGTIE